MLPGRLRSRWLNLIKQIFRSETMKIRRSFILWMHIFSAIVFPVLLGAYYGNRYPTVNLTQVVISYYEFLSILTPIAVSIVICVIFDREQKAGNFKNVLSLPDSKVAIIQSQILYYWSLYALVVLGSTGIYYILLKFMFGLPMPSFFSIILTSIVFTLLAYVYYELTYLVIGLWGNGSGLILGFFGSLLSILSLTVLVDKAWAFIPWSWQIRLIGFWQPGVLQNTHMMFWYGSKYAVSVVLTMLMIIISSIYYKNWTGRRN
ncbi:lantibiotic immunity ABC transporter MutG family permease subunit [Pediococcus acidilactici]|uniref:lantibiotic immunity ABC transporter MutG family permease subunit n=1 Tax=Pediococcus acidilactici TaxID=1254 RepID=UPI00270B7F7B|nr:lantibiotic immunity ABC transporter MutG family permease subunit [Pediococcus acidilactici]MDO7803159.1 lantibiotic immunity ABC transporter MutG family permease subunit [Pediococcus acidilactici]